MSCTLMWPVSCFLFWVSPWAHEFLYISTYCSHSFDAQIFMSLANGRKPFQVAALSFWCNSSVFCYHLLQAFLELSLHHSYSQEPSSSKNPGFLVSGNNWDHNVGSRALIIIGPTHFSQHVLVSSRFCLVYLMWTFQFVCIVSFTLKIHLCPLLNCKHFKGLGSYAF